MPENKNTPWTETELILALNLYLKIGIADNSHPEVVRLSETLNRLSSLETKLDPKRFRNPNAVAMKLSDFAGLDRQYQVSDMKHLYKLERKVWNKYVRDDVGLKKSVFQINSSLEFNEVSEMKKFISGQGFRISQLERKALELAAMESSIKYYRSLGWKVIDVSANHPYDLKCVKNDDEELHVEVKGTTTDGFHILLTPGEVKHASEYPRMELFILHDIHLNNSKPGEISTFGGTKRVISPWDISEGDLNSIGYQYTPNLPGK